MLRGPVGGAIVDVVCGQDAAPETRLQGLLVCGQESAPEHGRESGCCLGGYLSIDAIGDGAMQTQDAREVGSRG
jgi:hypothetical protein